MNSTGTGRDAVLEAAARAVARLGLHKVSMEDISLEADMSRATLYRRFGNRDAIISALITAEARPFVEETIRLSAKAKSFAEQIEINTLQAVLNVHKYEALAEIFSQGNDPQSLRLISPVYKELVSVNLIPSLDSARLSGELREGLDNEEVADWLMREFLILISEGPWTPQRLRRRIQQFLLPVLLRDQSLEQMEAPAAGDSVEQRLGRLEKRLGEMHQLLALTSHRVLGE